MTDKTKEWIKRQTEIDNNMYTKNKLLKYTKYSNNIIVHCTVTVAKALFAVM